jgi:hypothetical protein
MFLGARQIGICVLLFPVTDICQLVSQNAIILMMFVSQYALFQHPVDFYGILLVNHHDIGNSAWSPAIAPNFTMPVHVREYVLMLPGIVFITPKCCWV